MDILRWALIIISLPVIGWLVVRTKKSAKQLNEGIGKYKEEQEELERQKGRRGPVDPYEQMAQLFAPKEEEDKDK